MTSTYAALAYDALHAALAAGRKPAPARPTKPLTAAAAPVAPSTPKPSIDIHERFALCVHEAAHAVWAAMSGARITECSITADGMSGLVRTAEESARAEEIAYAGIWAQARWERGARPSRGALLAAIEAASAEDRECFARVPQPVTHIEADLEHVWPRIKALAAHLYTHGNAEHGDVERVLGVRPGLNLSTVAWAHRQRIDPATITVGGAA